MQQEHSLIAELETILASGSSERRVELLNRVTALFLTQSDTANPEHVAVFDEVLLRLADGIENRARIELAELLAPVSNAPATLLNKLAHDDLIDVAGPVLRHSECLDDRTLVDCSSTRGQAHLLAISQRRSLSKTVTTVLVERGDREVMRSVAGNSGARFSKASFDMLVRRATDDDCLAELVGLRRDLPAECFNRLVKQASEAARIKLANSYPERASAIASVVDEITGQIAPRRNYAAAKAMVGSLVQQRTLTEDVLREFARAGRFEETVAALAAMSGLTCDIVDQAMAGPHADPILIIAKASSLSWPTVQSLLMVRASGLAPAPHTLESHRTNYLNLSVQAAQRVLRFYKVRRTVAGEGWKGGSDV